MASTSSTTNDREYDVFLSFRGADTRLNFTSHLYHALCNKKVNVFWDKKLERGRRISSTLLNEVIKGSKISIVIFSQNFASSEFCLEELAKILECQKSRGQVVLPVFDEVEKQTGRYGKALSSYEADSIEKMEKVQKWKSDLSEAADVAGWDLHNRDEVEVIHEIVQFVLQKLNPLKRVQVEVFPENRLVGKDFEINIKTIWAWLTAEDVSTIGIWGMGGVGKTTLLIHVYNMLLDKKEAFGQVYWVTVSQDFSIYKLQNLIAKVIELEFGTEEDQLKRAARLLKALSSKGKFVLILDDLWNHFDMNKVGIPIKSNGCKLISTTRSQSVCARIGLQKLKKIEPLSEEDAWYLFKDTLGHDLAKNVEPTAKNVAKECGGLPLGIVTMAGSMRGVDDIHEWNNALAELRRSEVRPDDMEVEVFPILKFSYARLNDWVLQQCFLFCALFPEDHKIGRDELIHFFVAEEIIELQTRRQMDFDKGHAMLNKLVKVSLLEDVEKYGERSIKMHDLIRDMAIQIMKESCPSIVEAGRQLKQVPEEKYWTDYIVWVSLMKNHITEIPSSYSPMCSTLSTLLLSQNKNLKSIPTSFFFHFCGLKVLDLSDTGIVVLPKSVGCLGNLKALLLKWCSGLRNMPSLGKLTSLEMLDLFNCSSLEQVPKGLELLSNLTFLNLLGSGIHKLQSQVLTRLSHLQFLAFCSSCLHPCDALEVEAKEIAELKRVGSLSGPCHDFTKINEHVQLVSRMQRGRSGVPAGLCNLPFLAIFPRYSDFVIEFKVEELAQLQKLESLSWRFKNVREFNEYVQLVSRMQRGWQIISYFFLVGERSYLIPDRPSSRKLCLQGCKIDTELFIQKDLKMLEIAHCTAWNGLRLKTNSFEPELMSLQIERCNVKYLFHLSSSRSILGILEKLIVKSLPELCALFGEEVEEPPTATTLVPFSCNSRRLTNCHTFGVFCSLTEIVISRCNNIKSLFSSRLVFQLP